METRECTEIAFLVSSCGIRRWFHLIFCVLSHFMFATEDGVMEREKEQVIYASSFYLNQYVEIQPQEI